MLWLLFGAVVVLLLIASGNLANLLLVRAAERRHEISVRRSLGAPLGRVARLLLVESLVLGVIGGAVGLFLAAAMVRSLPSMLPPDVPRLAEVGLNVRVLLFALVATMVPALCVTMAPLIQFSRKGFSATLRAARGSTAGGSLRGGLVAFQVALAMVLLVGASLMGRSMLALLSVDRGLRTDHLLTASVMPDSRNGAAAGRAFWRQALQSIEAIPGVVSAGTLLHLPTGGRTWSADIEIEGRPLASGAVVPRSAWQAVSTGYFTTAGIPLLGGRAFVPTDDAGAPRVIAVNRAFAERFFPGESPIGRRITAGNATVRQPATIVGVVGGVRHDSLSAPPSPEVYVPIEQTIVWATGLVVRTTTDPVSVASAVRERIWAIDANVPVTNVRSMDEVFAASLARPRMILTILGFFAGVGLLLGAIGIYGVVAFGVQQRLRELGIRAALGADASVLRVMVVRNGVGFALLGVIAGVPVALAIGGAMRGLVFGVPTSDPASYAVVAGVLVMVAVLASWWPARAASRSDPMVVLRND
jgi:predicted permease